MNRKEFIRSCASGLCACAASSMFPLSGLASAETKNTDDWRTGFVKRRYAKLLEILSSRMDEKTLNETLHELGTYCSGTQGGDEFFMKFRNDWDGFCKEMKKSLSGDDVTYDREKGIITMTSPERTDCFCPLNGVDYNTPKVVCNCSLGWQQNTFETLLGKKVRVELKESVLRGGKRCVFEVHVGDAHA